MPRKRTCRCRIDPDSRNCIGELDGDTVILTGTSFSWLDDDSVLLHCGNATLDPIGETVTVQAR